MKSIVIYFTQSGTTKAAAEKIAAKTDSDIVEMTTSDVYPDNFDDLVAKAKEQIDGNERPVINEDFDFSDYKTIYLGFPIWYQQPPMIIHSFFEKFDLTDKTVIPFITSGSSSFSVCEPYMNNMKTNAKLENGFRSNSDLEIEEGLAL
ncbi:flavodoxin [Companilactobacillus baiquanensis]|uniref:Flavodoxin n=1 Tax=Companilactobacillus baiquanensis TaxID=2486005 RepID=A0ABW1UX43_9LACO|nr:flavodoxin [Companilactobacillus baiquanensis]